nr:VCBS repeat-containing protein [Planctomycetota bacterium]
MPDNRSALLLRFAVLLSILGFAACDAAKPGADASLEAASPAVFESRRVIETAATGIAASAAADLSGDRRLDLVVAPRDVNELWIFVGSRAAGFAEKPTVVLPLDRSATRVLVADLDGGRDKGLVCVLGDRILQVFDNDGYGRFTEQPPELLAEPVVDIVGGDFDQDGVDEFVLAMSAAIEVWTQRDGRHRRTQRIDLDAQTSLSAACVAWIDADAYPDLAVTDAGRNEVLVWHGSAHGIDGQRRLLLGLPGSGASALCAGDVTGDASTDLVVIVQGAANLVVFAGNGLGNFEPATLFEVQGLARSLWLARFPPPSAERLGICFADRTEHAVVETKPLGAF